MRRMRRRTAAVQGGPDTAAATQFASDVQYYLMQNPRQLPSRYLYDALGSALFEAICRLPWYRITRAEERLLQEQGADVLRRVAPLSTIVELGSGSGEKLRILLGTGGPDIDRVDVHLVDVSASALETSARAIESAADVRVTTHQAAYEDGLRDVLERLDGEGRVLVLFLGSSVGNLEHAAAGTLLGGLRRVAQLSGVPMKDLYRLFPKGPGKLAARIQQRVPKRRVARQPLRGSESHEHIAPGARGFGVLHKPECVAAVSLAQHQEKIPVVGAAPEHDFQQFEIGGEGFPGNSGRPPCIITAPRSRPCAATAGRCHTRARG